VGALLEEYWFHPTSRFSQSAGNSAR